MRATVPMPVPLLLAIVGLLVAAPGCATRSSGESTTPTEESEVRPVEAFYEAEGTQVIRDATRVLAYRIDPAVDPTSVTDPDPTRILGYRISGDEHVVTPELAQRFQQVLLDPHNYSLPPPGSAFMKLCGEFQPGVALRIVDSTHRQLDILVCFLCGDLGIKTWVYDGERPDDPPTEELITADVSDRNDVFMRLFAEAMPSYSELRLMLQEHEARAGGASD